LGTAINEQEGGSFCTVIVAPFGGKKGGRGTLELEKWVGGGGEKKKTGGGGGNIAFHIDLRSSFADGIKFLKGAGDQARRINDGIHWDTRGWARPPGRGGTRTPANRKLARVWTGDRALRLITRGNRAG